MYETYIKSLQMIKTLNRKLSKKEYTKLAKKYDLLNVVNLEFMSGKTFNTIIKESVKYIT